MSKKDEKLDQSFDDAFDEALMGDAPDEDITDDADQDQTPEGDPDEDQDTLDTGVNTETDTTADSGDLMYARLPEGTPDKEGDEDYKDLYEDLLTKFKKLENDTNAWAGRIRAANQRAEEAERQLEEFQKQSPVEGKPSTPEDSSDDDQVLEDFYKEFPELRKPLEILAEKKAKALIGELKPTIDSIQETTKTSARNAHIQAIADAHPDWETIRDSGKLKDWIDAQSPLIKSTYQRVYKEGSTQEVIEMFDTYKRVNGISGNSNLKSSSEAPATSNKKAESLLAVPGSPGGPPSAPPAKDDFDAAWEEANAS